LPPLPTRRSSDLAQARRSTQPADHHHVALHIDGQITRDHRGIDRAVAPRPAVSTRGGIAPDEHIAHASARRQRTAAEIEATFGLAGHVDITGPVDSDPARGVVVVPADPSRPPIAAIRRVADQEYVAITLPDHRSAAEIEGRAVEAAGHIDVARGVDRDGGAVPELLGLTAADAL